MGMTDADDPPEGMRLDQSIFLGGATRSNDSSVWGYVSPLSPEASGSFYVPPKRNGVLSSEARKLIYLTLTLTLNCSNPNPNPDPNRGSVLGGSEVDVLASPI